MTPILIFSKKHFANRLILISAIYLGIISISAANVSPFVLDSCTDIDRPVITIDVGSCNPATFDTSISRCMGFLSIKASAFDNETPPDHLSFYYQIDLYNDGMGVFSGYDCRVGPLTIKEFNSGGVPIFSYNAFAKDRTNAFDASGIYPLGTHKICWTVEDTYGNVAKLCQLFEIRDCQAPVPVCQIVLKRNYLFFTATTVFAKEFNYNSFDNCTSKEKLKYYFNGDPTMESISIDCDDFWKSEDCDVASLNLQLWVEDEEGNADYCLVLLKVFNELDPTICCDLSSNKSIQGQILASKNGIDSVQSPEVEIYINSSGSGKSRSSNKYFTFSYINPALYTLSGNRSGDSLNSVSTFDIIKIKRHILGVEKFANPFQEIASDVNLDSIVSTADLSEIRNLILGTINSFSGIKDWKVFPVRLDNTILNIYNEEIKVDLDRSTNKYVDLRLVKMGDVNDFSRPKSYKPLIESSDSLIIKYSNKNVKKGDTVAIKLILLHFNSVIGFQGTFKFDTSRIKYSRLNSVLLNFYNDHLGGKFLKDGFLTVSYNDDELFPVGTDSAYITFDFIVQKDGDLCDALSFTSDLTPAEAYTDSELIKNIKIESCDVVIKNKEIVADQIKMYPNPAEDILHFDFPKEISFPLQLDFYSKDGKVINRMNIPTQQENFSCKLDQFPLGMYFIKISEKNRVTFRKFIKI